MSGEDVQAAFHPRHDVNGTVSLSLRNRSLHWNEDYVLQRESFYRLSEFGL